ncbi:MAG: PaaI family thioesterase [Anaerolineales bacterium]|nr:PaaI family thioesterase [Anaerolineales bacterium]
MVDFYFQDLYLAERADCWGCGRNNAEGLQIKSYWEDDEAVLEHLPRPYFTGHKGILNGGIIATLMDCHCMGLAMAHAHREAGRQIGSKPLITYVTASLKVDYLKPTPLTDEPVVLRARVSRIEGRKTFMTCSLYAQGVETARGEVLGIRLDETPQA